VAFDKVLTKQRCAAAGIPTPGYVVVNSPDAPWPEGLQSPLVVKPVRQGSSVGVHFVMDPRDWSGAVRDALRFDSQLLVEEKIEGRETTVAILEGRALPVVEVRPKAGGYDFNNKYTAGRTDYFCPAPFDSAVTLRIQQAAVGTFHAVGGRDYARVDVMVRQNGEPVVLEVNTLPGMTETSLMPKAAAAAGISYPALCERMVEMAARRNELRHVV
jgi:D-alanine-D-alanine ligase